MPGYALLPTMEEPTSNKTFRLSNEEIKERNEWIVSARERGMSVKDIAYEVGLTEVTVYGILRKNKAKNGKEQKNARVTKKLFDNPMQAAIYEHWNGGDVHPDCKRANEDWSFDGNVCPSCFGKEMLTMCAYHPDTGWPYDWAWYGQARYIHPNMVIPEGVIIPDIAYVDCED